MQKINKINKIGLSLLEYKEELTKDYPPIVRNSLLSTISGMYENEVIDSVVYELMISKTEDFNNFKEYILSNSNYTKTHAELFKEFEAFRVEVDNKLKDNEIYGLITQSIIEENSIFAIKTFSIGEEFIMGFFGVEEKDLNNLMKKKGFAEKFAAFRLTKVINDIIDDSGLVDNLNIDKSLAYFNDKQNSYNIELIIKLDIDSIDLEDDILFDAIRELEMKASSIYKEKMVV